MISTQEFLSTIWEDYKSPTTSSFCSKVPQCRQTMNNMDMNFEIDKTELTRFRKSVKGLHSSGNAHLLNENLLSNNLQQLGNTAITRDEQIIGDAFIKFATVANDLSKIMNNMMQSISNIIMFPLDSVTKVLKTDVRKSLDKASKEYDAKLNKLEKEKRQQAKDAGMLRTDISPAEIAADIEKEKRSYQLQIAEYLLKMNEVKSKKGVELLQHLIEFNCIQSNYFVDGQQIIDEFRTYVDQLMSSIVEIRQKNDNDRRQLLEVKETLKLSVGCKEGTTNLSSSLGSVTAATGAYNLHQLQGNKAHGYQYQGHLLKKSDGKVRKVWQRRKCAIERGYFTISHSDSTKAPTKLNLLTCQIKLNVDDPGKKCFDMISSNPNRTYHFQAEDKKDFEMWISVINNAVEAVFLKETIGESTTKGGGRGVDESLQELVKAILDRIVRLPGNSKCADCGALDPDWLSVNLGVLICVDCCGVHRLMGVHISRTQSIVIDELNTSQLLLANVVSNKTFNDIMEATLDQADKPTSESDMETRKVFIRGKYESHSYAIVTCSSGKERLEELELCIRQSDLGGLLQCHAEGTDFLSPLSAEADNLTALHYAISRCNEFNLPLVDFMLQNSNSQNLDLCASDSTGDNVLHRCARHDRTECMKLVLRIRSDLINTRNNQKETALDIARQCNHRVCIDVIESVLAGRKEVCANINIGWGLISDDRFYDLIDQSDDELDAANGMEIPRIRPLSLVEGELVRKVHNRERALTADFALKNSNNSPDLVSLASIKRKGPAPLPPEQNRMNLYRKNGHTRNRSDGLILTQLIQPSPPKNSSNNQPLASDQMPETGTCLAGAKLVLPPPAKFRTYLKKTDRSSERFGNSQFYSDGAATKVSDDSIRRFSLSTEIENSTFLRSKFNDVKSRTDENNLKSCTLPKGGSLTHPLAMGSSTNAASSSTSGGSGLPPATLSSTLPSHGRRTTNFSRRTDIDAVPAPAPPA